MKINIETSKWYKSQRGSVIFPLSPTNEYNSIYAFGLCKPFPKGNHYWVENGRFGIDCKITSPIEVLKAINEGMKHFGYHNDVWVKPYNCENKVKFIDYRFNFKNKLAVNSLMEEGKLYLENSEGNSILVLKNGKFPVMRSRPLKLNFLEYD